MYNEKYFFSTAPLVPVRVRLVFKAELIIESADNKIPKTFSDEKAQGCKLYSAVT